MANLVKIEACKFEIPISKSGTIRFDSADGEAYEVTCNTPGVISPETVKVPANGQGVLRLAKNPAPELGSYELQLSCPPSVPGPTMIIKVE